MVSISGHAVADDDMVARVKALNVNGWPAEMKKIHRDVYGRGYSKLWFNFMDWWCGIRPNFPMETLQVNKRMNSDW